ncbi:hypothetical protein ACFYZX_14745 [Nocardiopsis dassonvillei]
MNATPQPDHDPDVVAHAERLLRFLGGPPQPRPRIRGDLPYAPAMGRPPQRDPAPPRKRGFLARIAHALASPAGPPPPTRSQGRAKDRENVTVRLAEYRADPAQERQLELLKALVEGMDAYTEIHAERMRVEREQAEQAHRAALATHRVAVASMIFGAAGWLVALFQLLLPLLGVGG